MTVSYCAFLSDGRFVSTTPFTLSIVQCSRPDAMNRDSSLCDARGEGEGQGQGANTAAGEGRGEGAHLSTKSTLTPKERARLSSVRLR